MHPNISDNNWTAWNFVKLFELYYNLYPKTKSKTITYLFNSTKNIIAPNKKLVRLLSKIPNISKGTRKIKIHNPIIYDFIATLFLFNEVCTSKTLKEKQFYNLKQLLDYRFCKNKDYFINDNVFTSNYEFV